MGSLFSPTLGALSGAGDALQQILADREQKRLLAIAQAKQQAQQQFENASKTRALDIQQMAATAKETPKPVAFKPVTYRDPATGQTVIENMPEDSPYKVQAVDKPGPAPSAEQDNSKAIALYAKQRSGAALAPDESNWLSGFEKERTLGTNTSAALAADRQAAALEHSTAQQQSSQAFSAAEVGRKTLTDKVDTPFQTALASSQTLRDTVDAAKGGNLVAANLQGLETTMAAIRAQGLNRINTVELNLSPDAGSLWDRIQGRVGKLAVGQPMDPKLQQDLLDFADVLDKQAKSKYRQGFKTITDRYGLKDEKPVVPLTDAASQRATTISKVTKNGTIYSDDGGKSWYKLGQ